MWNFLCQMLGAGSWEVSRGLATTQWAPVSLILWEHSAKITIHFFSLFFSNFWSSSCCRRLSSPKSSSSLCISERHWCFPGQIFRCSFPKSSEHHTALKWIMAVYIVVRGAMGLSPTDLSTTSKSGFKKWTNKRNKPFGAECENTPIQDSWQRK